jgi:site-specific DNA-adenine methylase
MFYLSQENWHAYKDPFVRSAFFYILNQCSSLGYASCGEFEPERLTVSRQGLLKRFQLDNFHLKWDNAADFSTGFNNLKEGSTLLLPVGPFSQNLFEEGKSLGLEMTTVYHQRLYETLAALRDRKWMVVYENTPQVLKLYKNYNIEIINQYGRPTTNAQQGKELLIANF